MITKGKGAKDEIDDILLSRYASYLIAQNGDSRKEEISFAQNYLAVQTRRAELVEQCLLEFERVKAREKLSQTEKQLKKKMQVPDGRPVADFLPTINIRAKDLAAEMTSLNAQSNNLKGHNPIEKEHVDNYKAVRNMLTKRGIVPEKRKNNFSFFVV